jgi:translation initiation factor IF-3
LWRCLYINSKKLQINDEITSKEVRTIGADGSQLGIMPIKDALNLAASQNLDLVKMVANANPAVCKIMDYGKYRFEQAKKDKEAKKNQHTIDIKEIRLSLNIDTHDFETKVNHALRFSKNGDKIKVSIRFKGREMGRSNIGLQVMDKFAKACGEFTNVEKTAKLDGRSMIMFLSSKNASSKTQSLSKECGKDAKNQNS